MAKSTTRTQLNHLYNQQARIEQELQRASFENMGQTEIWDKRMDRQTDRQDCL
jgi:hypothetical protein